MLTSFLSGVQFTEEAVQKHFDEFFSDIYCELEEKVSLQFYSRKCWNVTFVNVEMYNEYKGGYDYIQCS